MTGEEYLFSDWLWPFTLRALGAGAGYDMRELAPRAT